jgi:hypothetical protein
MLTPFGMPMLLKERRELFVPFALVALVACHIIVADVVCACFGECLEVVYLVYVFAWFDLLDCRVAIEAMSLASVKHLLYHNRTDVFARGFRALEASTQLPAKPVPQRESAWHVVSFTTYCWLYDWVCLFVLLTYSTQHQTNQTRWFFLKSFA